MRKLINILKEVLNDSQKQSLAKATVEKVKQMIQKDQGAGRKVVIHKNGDKSYVEVHLGDLDIFFHSYKSNTSAKFIPSNDKGKLPYIMVYNANIDIKDAKPSDKPRDHNSKQRINEYDVTVDFDESALFDEILKFLNSKGNIKEDADAETDIKQGKMSDKYIEYIDNQIKSYHSNNNVIRKIEDGHYDAVEINFPKLTIQLSANKSPMVHDADFVPAKGKNGKALIKVNRSTIKTQPKLEVNYDESGLKHELKHYYDSLNNSKDFKQNVKKQFKINTSKGTVTDPDAYWNNPNEVNAYFFEHFMPEVLSFLKKEREIPGTFEEFQKDLLSDRNTKDFYGKLNPENKKKVDDRLQTYYKDILTNPTFQIEKDDEIDNSKLEKTTYSWIKKLKDKLGLFEEK